MRKKLLTPIKIAPEEHAREILNAGCPGKIFQEKLEIQFWFSKETVNPDFYKNSPVFLNVKTCCVIKVVNWIQSWSTRCCLWDHQGEHEWIVFPSGNTDFPTSFPISPLSLPFPLYVHPLLPSLTPHDKVLILKLCTSSDRIWKAEPRWSANEIKSLL